MIKHKRRHFQLLEIMIAIFLLTLCALPILQSFVGMTMRSTESMRLQKRDHLVHIVHGGIVESLYRKAIDWRPIAEGGVHEQLGKNNEARLAQAEELAEAFQKLSFTCHYHIGIIKPIQLKKTSKNFLFAIEIVVEDLLNPKKAPAIYTYEIYAQCNNEVHQACGYKTIKLNRDLFSPLIDEEEEE